MGSVKPLNVVELGPGHGTLMSDILRTFLKLMPLDLPHLSLHLVEASPNLARLQEAKLCGSFHSSRPEGYKAITKQGVPVHWHGSVGQVPKGFTFFIANEVKVSRNF